MAGQIFELSNSLNKLMHLKPKRITKLMLEEHSKLIDIKYGENILRHVIQTSDFSFPSEDYTGQINDIVAKKTREMLLLHAEMMGREPMPAEEIKIEEAVGQNGKKKRKKRNMEKYAPLIFEECYVK